MRAGVRGLLSALLVLIFGLGAAFADEAEQTGLPNLGLGLVSPVGGQAVTSGASIPLVAEVEYVNIDNGLTGAFVRASLRREDKSEPCTSSVAAFIVPQGSPSGTVSVSLEIDTTGLLGGSYEVVGSVESDLAESDLLDNSEFLGFITILDPLPELHPVELSVDPATPLEWGETATVYSTIANTGRRASGAFHVVFSICDLPIGISEGDATCATWIEFGSRLVPGLGRDTEERVAVPLDLAEVLGRATLAAGTYRLRVSVEHPEDVPVEGPDGAGLELDTHNNSLIGAVSVGESTLGYPDLVPRAISFNEKLPLAWEDRMTATVLVENIGGGDAVDGFWIRFSYRRVGDATWSRIGPDNDRDGLADDLHYDDPLPIEQGDNQAVVTLSIDPQGIVPSGQLLLPGSYELRAQIGGSNSLTDCSACGELLESNTDNNALIAGFSVRGTELQAEGLELPSEPIRQGDSIVVVATVANMGDRPAYEFSTGFYVNGERFDTFLYSDPDGLDEDQRTRVQGVLSTSDLPPGGYDLRVVVDPDDRIPEYDEGNNAVTAPIVLLGPDERRAELLITEMRLTPASPLPIDADAMCSLVVRNVGTRASGPFRIELETTSCTGDCPQDVAWQPLVRMDGTAATASVSGLERSEARLIEIPFVTAGVDLGPRQIRAIVDAGNEVTELDELNNGTTIAYSVGEAVGRTEEGANLLCDGISVEAVGEGVVAYGQVRNNGTEATGAFQVSWSVIVSGQSLLGETVAVNGLAPGVSTVVTHAIETGTFPPGGYNLVMQVDAAGQVAESNEQDNECREILYVGYEADSSSNLVVSNLQFSPPCSPPCSPNGAEVTVGERVVALATIQNQGTVAVGPFAVQFGVTDASGTVVGSQRISWPGLAAMAEAQVSYAFDTVAIGSFTASVVLDADDVIAETAESDNLAQGTFQVNAPSLLTSELVLERSGTSILGVVTDTASDLLYSIWSDGDIYRTDTDAMSELVFSGNGTASAFAVSTSGLPEGVLAVDGIIHRVNLPTGSVSSVSEELWAIPRKLALAGDGSVFAVMDNSVVAFTQGLAFLAEASLSGSVTAAAYDDAREVLYVLTSNGLFAFNDGLDPLCSVTMFAGTPTALELGATGLYVGTSAGYVYAMSYCMSHGGSPPLIVDSWRYPASGELGGSVTAITNDPRGFDPVYVAASSVVSLTYGGTLLWTYPADGASLAGTISEIAVEERTGRLFFVDAAGAPRLVETNGADVSFGVATGGSPAGFAVVALDEYRAETRAGSQLIRAYYYGMGDSVFRIESDR